MQRLVEESLHSDLTFTQAKHRATCVGGSPPPSACYSNAFTRGSLHHIFTATQPTAHSLLMPKAGRQGVSILASRACRRECIQPSGRLRAEPDLRGLLKASATVLATQHSRCSARISTRDVQSGRAAFDVRQMVTLVCGIALIPSDASMSNNLQLTSWRCPTGANRCRAMRAQACRA